LFNLSVLLRCSLWFNRNNKKAQPLNFYWIPIEILAVLQVPREMYILAIVYSPNCQVIDYFYYFYMFFI